MKKFLRKYLIAAIIPLAATNSAWAWGAVSYDRITNEIRSCSGHESEANAQTCSKLHCQGDCRVVATFENTCAAVSIDRRGGRAFVSRSVDEARAREETIVLCGQAGGTECVIEESLCDVPR